MAKLNWHLSNLLAFIWLNLFIQINRQLRCHKPFVEQIEKNTVK